MKRISTFLLALVLAFYISGCGNSSSQTRNNTTQEPSQSQENNQQAEKSPSEEPESQPSVESDDGNNQSEEPETPAEPELEGVGDLGDYHVEIKGAKLGEDYKGNKIIVITYEWTNNSDETKSPMFSISEKAFQDGVELTSAMVMDKEVYDSETSMKEVRPGTTIDVQCAFVMTSESIVEFEMEELISFSKEMVSMNFDPTVLQ